MLSARGGTLGGPSWSRGAGSRGVWKGAPELRGRQIEGQIGPCGTLDAWTTWGVDHHDGYRQYGSPEHGLGGQRATPRCRRPQHAGGHSAAAGEMMHSGSTAPPVGINALRLPPPPHPVSQSHARRRPHSAAAILLTIVPSMVNHGSRHW